MALLPVPICAKEADWHQCQGFAPCGSGCRCQCGTLLAEVPMGIPQADQTSPQFKLRCYCSGSGAQGTS